MDAKIAMEIGMKIADDHEKAINDLLSVSPGASTKQLLHGAKVYLGSQIMQALCRATEEKSAA